MCDLDFSSDFEVFAEYLSPDKTHGMVNGLRDACKEVAVEMAESEWEYYLEERV